MTIIRSFPSSHSCRYRQPRLLQYFGNEAVIAPTTKSITIVAFLLCLGGLLNLKQYISSNHVNLSLSTKELNVNDNVNMRYGLSTKVDKTANQEQIIQDTSAQQPIAWLMTFPNSGTTYTLYLVATVTGMNTATNYGHDPEAQGVKSHAIILNHASDSVLTDTADGHIPVWSGYNWVGDPLKRTMNPPTKGYILTKTHCGGYCFECFVKSQIEHTRDPRAFTKACATGQLVQNSTIGKLQTVEAHTNNITKIGRAVHIIRDPFDNVVSRFQYHLKKLEAKNESETLARYPSTRDGFRKFCHDLGRKWTVKEEEESLIYSDLFEWIKDVPCHSDFFRYIQWHNLAFATTAELGIPSMVLHYENYSSDFNKTKEELLRFLYQDEVNPPPSFIAGKTFTSTIRWERSMQYQLCLTN